MIVAWLGVSLLRRWQRNAMYRQAQSQLDKVQQEIEQHGLSSKTIVTLSKLARQIAISCYDRQTVAGISGQAWLEFLDKTGDTKAFTTGIGRTLRDAPYCNSQPPAEAKALPMLLKQWMHKQKKTRANRVLPNLRTRS